MSGQTHDFANAQPGVSMERSTLSRPSRTITAFDANNLVPILVDEVLPGDTYKLTCQVLAWLATPLKPFLDNLILTVHFWFVPNRLGWDNWQRFQGEQINPGDSTSFTVPQIDIAGGQAGVSKLADYFGIPLIATTYEVNALPFRAYNRIWTDFYRDQNLQNSLTLDTGDANSTEANHVIKKRGKQKDYLTGALPFAQKGDVVPSTLSGTVPVTSTTAGKPTFDVGGAVDSAFENLSAGNRAIYVVDAAAGQSDVTWGTTTGLEADLSTGTGATVNALRTSIAIQHVYELDARGGTRHPEQLKARWGVTSQDFRLQRPEYLGGGSTPISVTPIPKTSGAVSGIVGELAGFGVGQGNCGAFTHSFVEHGYVIALASVRSDLTYQEGVARHWNYSTRFDYYEPAFAGLGEQAVYNREIFVSNDANDLLVWGYQERGAHMKYGRSMVTGIMNGNFDTPLDQWHLAELFETLPTLNASFIEGNTPVDRVIAVVTEPHIIMDAYFSNQCTRVMPVHNTPGLNRL